MKKLCYFINSDWYFDLHWSERALSAQKSGFEIHLISHFVDERLLEKYKTKGFFCHNIPVAAQSFNALVFFRAYQMFRKLITTIKPDILHCITIKPALIGGIVARQYKLPVVISFVGLGRVFSSEKLYLRFLRKITIYVYKFISCNKKTIFMFEHDKDRQFLKSLLNIDSKQTIVIDGAGVNPEQFNYSIEPQNSKPVVLFASRMLWSKGLGELIKAKELLERKNIFFTLNVAGILVNNDKDAIPLKQIQEWNACHMINWLGHTTDMCELIKSSNVVALPSIYAEGIPRILLEASSVGRACIAYNTGGCDSLIIDNENGFIINSNSVDELATKLEVLFNNPEKRITMGMKGRKRVQEKFSSNLVIANTLRVYNDLLKVFS